MPTKMDKVTNSEIIEENNYYPFGLKHKGYNNNVTSLGNSLARQYKYNGKELNEELGLNWYDYGARNYQADLGRWFNVDPLAEKYPGMSPYNYCTNTPVIFIDPDGKRIDVSYIYRTNKKGEYVNPELVKAFEIFAKSKTGSQILANYAEKGQKIAGKTYNKNGKYHNNKVDLSFSKTSDDYLHASATTSSEIKEKRLDVSINLESGKDVDDYIDDIGHEIVIHGNRHAEDFSDDGKLNMSKGVDKDIIKYVEKYYSNPDRALLHHIQERYRDKDMIKYITPILQQYYKSVRVKKTRKDIIKEQYSFED